MDNKPLNCTVFFNPTDGEKSRKSKSSKLKEEKKTSKPEILKSQGNLFSIKYVPEQFQNSPIKIVAHSGESDILGKEVGSFSGSSIEIGEFISPYTTSPDGLQMHYVIDDKVECKSCLEMKYALDFTFQKLFLKSLKLEEGGGKDKDKEGKVPSGTKEKRNSRKNQQCAELQPKFCTTPIIKEVEETGPLMKFFSRLIRSATIDKMKIFSRNVAEKLAKFETCESKRKKTFKVSIKPNETEGKKQEIKNPSQAAIPCESCQRFQEAVYAIVNKLYEEVGIQTDFPTVQTLETYAFLVYPNDDAQKNSSCKRNNNNKRRVSAPNERTGIRKGFSTKTWETRYNRRTEEELVREENKKMLKSRIERHKAVFAACKNVHIIVALGLSFLTILLILANWLTEDRLYTQYVILVMTVLLFGCLYNAYMMIFNKTYSFKNYFIIPICWVLLALSNGKCDAPKMPNNVCDPNIHFMSHIYLFIVFLEYYIASGIHAVVVLEINQVRKMSIKELLKYSVFNFPLLIIVFGYAIFRLIVELRNRIKTQPSEIFSEHENTEIDELF